MLALALVSPEQRMLIHCSLSSIISYLLKVYIIQFFLSFPCIRQKRVLRLSFHSQQAATSITRLDTPDQVTCRWVLFPISWPSSPSISLSILVLILIFLLFPILHSLSSSSSSFALNLHFRLARILDDMSEQSKPFETRLTMAEVEDNVNDGVVEVCLDGIFPGSTDRLTASQQDAKLDACADWLIFTTWSKLNPDYKAARNAKSPDLSSYQNQGLERTIKEIDQHVARLLPDYLHDSASILQDED